ncbi:MAG: hypothetical protein KDD69_19065 [Bdellovibrionales bacterium]|nr:hypothetical protein [Bdellovibrionales bacterium]
MMKSVQRNESQRVRSVSSRPSRFLLSRWKRRDRHGKAPFIALMIIVCLVPQLQAAPRDASIGKLDTDSIPPTTGYGYSCSFSRVGKDSKIVFDTWDPAPQNGESDEPFHATGWININGRNVQLRETESGADSQSTGEYGDRVTRAFMNENIRVLLEIQQTSQSCENQDGREDEGECVGAFYIGELTVRIEADRQSLKIEGWCGT